MSESCGCSRRMLIKNVAVGAGIAVVMPALTSAAEEKSAPAKDPWRGLKFGVATYSLRKLDVDAAVKGIARVGLAYASIKDFHMPMKTTAAERKAVVKKFKDAGVTPLSCGVVSMKNTEASVRTAFDYARDAGIPTIVCDPAPAAMPLLDRFVKEYDIRLAIHNHGPESGVFKTPEDAWKAAEKYDSRIGLCIDVGHTARAGADPVRDILRFRERLYDVHIKDIEKLAPRAEEIEVGRGVLDIPGMLRALLEIRFTHLIGFEYENHPDDPLPGLAESVGYVKGVLAAL